MQEATGTVIAQPSDADAEVVEHRTRRKLTKRKKTDPCMESQPLASANQADTETQAPYMATDGVNAKASTAHCTVATGDGEGFQAGPEPSSLGTSHELAEIQHTAADDSPQLQDGPVLHDDCEEDMWVATGAMPNKGFGSEAVCIGNVAEVADSQDGSLAAGPPKDDEAEVCDQFNTCMLYWLRICVRCTATAIQGGKFVHVLLVIPDCAGPGQMTVCMRKKYCSAV